MVRLCNYGTALIFNVHIGFLTFQDHLYLSYQTGTPCTQEMNIFTEFHKDWTTIVDFLLIAKFWATANNFYSPSI